LGEIPHRAVAARIKDGIEAFLFDTVEPNSLAKLSFCSSVFLEPAGKVSPEFGLVTLWIEGGAAPLLGGKCDLCPSLLENVIGSGELLKPEPGLAPRVSELVVRSENHQDLHSLLLLLGACHQRTRTAVTMPAHLPSTYPGFHGWCDHCIAHEVQERRLVDCSHSSITGPSA